MIDGDLAGVSVANATVIKLLASTALHPPPTPSLLFLYFLLSPLTSCLSTLSLLRIPHPPSLSPLPASPRLLSPSHPSPQLLISLRGPRSPLPLSLSPSALPSDSTVKPILASAEEAKHRQCGLAEQQRGECDCVCVRVVAKSHKNFRAVQRKTRASSRTGENTYDLPRDTILHRSSGSSSRTSTVGHKYVSQRESFTAFNFRSCLFIVLNEMEVRRARLPGNGTRCTHSSFL